MESLVNIALLIAQSIIMLSLGIGLEVKDFRRVIERKRIVTIALCAQVLFLPLLALLTIYLFSFSPLYAAGLMILAFCPGGVSSNIICKLAKGDVALSVTLTAVTSILAFLTVPFLVTLTMARYLSNEISDFSLLDIALVTFLITTTPVMLGVLIRHFQTTFARRIEKALERTAVVLWTLIVIGAFLSARETLADNMAEIGPGLVFLPVSMIVIGLLTGRITGFSRIESKTLAIEASIQNAPMAITLCVVITGSTGLPELALPAAIYSLTMYIVALPSVALFRRWDQPAIDHQPIATS
ncbi:bile acid:sodium symporter family protein [Parendozoicomonas haliclonae]|uniref:Sodium Bile acid symporter family protein n=1 Tax=Parendozoicomonas haliclonae TaxID=1960125 RepID=A0A1X7AS39_9GAMM|nr:bile acid:sodium symporter family protein [Parendozoicomonas haliclonae]SMA50919.1 Sodium Bile acid symporter family protein [Parendozoicomonas haliclonae]